MPEFRFEARRYPASPGCYLMKDAAGRVIYVGKAKDLRKRLASYFQGGRKHSRTRRLVERIRDIEVVLVNNEIESLVLEHNLIKHYRPRYNVMLVSDEHTYPYIVLTDEAFPRFAPYKRHRVNWALEGLPDRALVRRFGPYPGNRFRDTLLEYVNETYLLRQCHPLPTRACLLLHIHKCSAPCEALVQHAAYEQAVRRAARFLSRPPTRAVREMRVRMQQCAERLEFERASRIKAQLAVLERALSAQIVERDIAHDQDVICHVDGWAAIMRIRQGRVLQFDLHALAMPLADFLVAHYRGTVPHEVIVDGLSDPRTTAERLGALSGEKVRITVPRSGMARALHQLCRRNLDYRLSVHAAHAPAA